MEFKKHNRRLRHILAMPFIYMMIIPVIILDVFLEIYHRICFPLYGISCVKRSDYIKIDRHKLSYLSFPEKVNCVYCGYGNGIANYAAKIAGETEAYWCGIKHKKRKGFVQPSHQHNFLEYGDENSYRKIKESKKGH